MYILYPSTAFYYADDFFNETLDTSNQLLLSKSERERERDRDRQRERQMETQIEADRDRERDRERHRERERERERDKAKYKFVKVYIHPLSKIEEAILTMASIKKYAIIISDFNVASNNIKRRQIADFLSTTSFLKVETLPTFLMENNEDTTSDLLFYTSNLDNTIERVVLLPDLRSDHLALHVTLNLETSINTEQVVKYNFRKCNMEAVNMEMKDFVDSAENMPVEANSINNFCNKLQDTILKTSQG
nr:unnamed protein product [Callosobruchus analis]